MNYLEAESLRYHFEFYSKFLYTGIPTRIDRF